MGSGNRSFVVNYWVLIFEILVDYVLIVCVFGVR